MRVLHLSTLDSGGGAARGAYWLHRALAGRVDSRMLVQEKRGDDPLVTQYPAAVGARLARRADRLVGRLYPQQRGEFSAAAWPRRVDRAVAALRPDIVNVHWINEGFVTPENLARLRAPLVWTLRDLWPLTGGCHYAQGCGRFEARCGACPVLGSRVEPDLSRLGWHRKARLRQRPLVYVAISEWMAAQARRASLARGHEVVVIPNAVDEAVFRPQERRAARAALGLPQDRDVVLFSAMDPLRDRRKGLEELRAALALLAAEPGGKRLHLVVAGPLYGEPPHLPVPCTFLGQLDDDQHLARVYAAADLTAMPSLEEAFGKVAMESLACGTPVVCFADTGPAEIVGTGPFGYRAALGDVADLARGIRTLLELPDRVGVAEQARAQVLARYTYAQQADAYLSVYRRLLDPAYALETRD